MRLSSLRSLNTTRFPSFRNYPQFWAAYVPCEAQHKDAVQQTLEQIDVIIRLTDKYRPKLTMCNSAFGEYKLARRNATA